MSENLIDVFKSAVGGQIGDQLGGLLGESGDKAGSALDAGLPAILGGLIEKASGEGGASALEGLMGEANGGILDNLGGLLGGGDHSQLQNSGAGILKSLLGDRVGGLIDIISNVSGMGKGSSGSLLSMLAPMVMGFLAKKMGASGGGIGGLIETLMGQKEHVAAAMPDGMADSLGFADMLGTNDSLVDKAADAVSGAAGAVTGAAGDAAGAVKDVAGDAASAVTGAAGSAVDAVGNVGGAAVDSVKDVAGAGGSLLGKLIPLILVAILAFLAFTFLKGCKEDVDDVKVPDAPAMPELTVDNAAAETGNILTGLGDTLSGVTDADSATAALPELAKSATAVSGLSDKLSSLPGPVQGIVKGVIGEKLGGIVEMIAKVKDIPGVGAILGDKVDGILTTLQALAE